uniref:(California timema) hypothetical protein n=1 Tax=Timema californicum TaxID=61474 RepID=A0A7R9J9K9_TIMCA|nr:unnamed protein product [Timema californicum]
MDTTMSRHLFLLELWLESLVFQTKKSKSPLNYPLCARVRFLECPEFSIEQGDPGTVITSGRIELKFAGGRSVLFAMDPVDLLGKMERQPLVVSFFSGKETDIRPNVVVRSSVPLANDLWGTVVESLTCSTLPISKTVSGSYPLISNRTEVKLGEMSLYARLVCFRESIVTEFDLNSGVQTYIAPEEQG